MKLATYNTVKGKMETKKERSISMIKGTQRGYYVTCDMGPVTISFSLSKGKQEQAVDPFGSP